MRPFIIVVASVCFGIAFAGGMAAQQAKEQKKEQAKPASKEKSQEPPKEAKTRKNASLAFAKVVDDPKLKRVLLIGDSISIGYTDPVRKQLEGKANVHRIPTNGGPTTNGVKHLKKWLGHSKWDVIHFNFGLHDIKVMEDGKVQVSLEQYEKNLREIVKQLKATKAKLIFATTTPVVEGTPLRKDSDTLAYNAVAKKVMEENEVAIDDLYEFSLPKLKEIQMPQNVHFTDQGSAVLAEQVAASIQAALE